MQIYLFSVLYTTIGSVFYIIWRNFNGHSLSDAPSLPHWEGNAMKCAMRPAYYHWRRLSASASTGNLARNDISFAMSTPHVTTISALGRHSAIVCP